MSKQLYYYYYYYFSGFLLLMFLVFCFRGLFGFGFLKSNLHISIIASYAMEIKQEKKLSSFYYAHVVQMNQCGMLRLSINGGIMFAILFL